MKITLLTENQVSAKAWDTCLAEWGFSAYIETNGINILFDTGTTDVYLRNAKSLGINLEDADFIVLSHYHIDHTGGLKHHQFKSKKKMIMHPQIIEKLPPEESKKYKKDFEIITSEKPLEFAKDIYYLGQIPRSNNFEKGKCEDEEMFDDSAIAIKTEKGAVIVSGCSHSGICNISEYAKKVTGQKLHAVIGGFHLFEDDEKAVDGTIEYFKTDTPEHLYPMHCVDFPTLARFRSEFNITKKSTGDVIEL